MGFSILPMLNKLIPAGIAWKALGKSSPKMKTFLGTALGAGYNANEILDFLREKAATSGEKQMAETGRSALPSEKAAAADIEKRQTGRQVVTGLASAAVGGVAGAVASQIPSLVGMIGSEEEKPSKSSEGKRKETLKQFKTRLSEKGEKTKKKEEKEALDEQIVNRMQEKAKKKTLKETELERFTAEYGQGKEKWKVGDRYEHLGEIFQVKNVSNKGVMEAKSETSGSYYSGPGNPTFKKIQSNQNQQPNQDVDAQQQLLQAIANLRKSLG